MYNKINAQIGSMKNQTDAHVYAIALNKWFSIKNPAFVALPQDFPNVDRGHALRDADITIYEVNSFGKIGYATKVLSLDESKKYKGTGYTPEHGLGHYRYITKKSDGRIHIAAAVEGAQAWSFEEPSEVVNVDRTEERATAVDEIVETTKPRNLNSWMDDPKFTWDCNNPERMGGKISCVQDIFKSMEAGVAEQLTKEYRDNPDNPMFSSLDKSKQWVALDTKRMFKLWLGSGRWAEENPDASEKDKKWRKSTHGHTFEKTLQDDYGIDIVMVTDTQVIAKEMPVSLNDIQHGKYLTFQVKGAPFAHKTQYDGKRSTFVEVSCINNEHPDGPMKEPSGINKTLANYIGYVFTSKLTAWLPTGKWRDLTNGLPETKASQHKDYWVKTSIGCRVATDTVLLDSALCVTVLPERYAEVFDKIHSTPVFEYAPSSDEYRKYHQSLKAGDFQSESGVGCLAQSWDLEQYLSYLSGTLDDCHITGRREIVK